MLRLLPVSDPERLVIFAHRGDGDASTGSNYPIGQAHGLRSDRGSLLFRQRREQRQSAIEQEVDDLFERWKDTGAKVVEAVEDKPWYLREFRVADLDGNQLRVFYDFNWEMGEERRLERHRRASRGATE
jgi:hypothetical protein